MTDCDDFCHSIAYSAWYVNSIIVIYYYMFNIDMYLQLLYYINYIIIYIILSDLLFIYIQLAIQLNITLKDYLFYEFY